MNILYKLIRIQKKNAIPTLQMYSNEFLVHGYFWGELTNNKRHLHYINCYLYMHTLLQLCKQHATMFIWTVYSKFKRYPFNLKSPVYMITMQFFLDWYQKFKKAKWTNKPPSRPPLLPSTQVSHISHQEKDTLKQTFHVWIDYLTWVSIWKNKFWECKKWKFLKEEIHSPIRN